MDRSKAFLNLCSQTMALARCIYPPTPRCVRLLVTSGIFSHNQTALPTNLAALAHTKSNGSFGSQEFLTVDSHSWLAR